MKPLALLVLTVLLLHSDLTLAAQGFGGGSGFRAGAASGARSFHHRGGAHFPAHRPIFVPGLFPHRPFVPGVFGTTFRHSSFFSGYPGVIYIGPGYYDRSYWSPPYWTAPYGWREPYPPPADIPYPYADESVTAQSRVRESSQLAPYDPTPQDVVERMLTLAQIKKGDLVYDLGAGDGRMVITAAKKYGVRAVGFEIDGGLVKLARENARKQGVEKLVEIRQQDFLTADISAANVVTLYLSQDGNLALREKLVSQLKPGARVVSYTFDMGDWQPKIAENYRDSAGDRHMIFLWQIGERQVYSERKDVGRAPGPGAPTEPIEVTFW